MNNVDNVVTSAQPTKEQWHALNKLQVLAATPGRNAPWYSATGKWTVSTGKLNNRGRYTWQVQLGSTPPGWALLDYLPPGAKKACWTDEPNGEHHLWIAFTVLVHHKSLERILKKEGLTVLYVNGCTGRELQKQYDVTNYNKLG